MKAYFNNSNFLFWQRWLFFTSLLFALAGAVFAISGKNVLFLPYDEMLAQVFWHTNKFPPQADHFRAFIYGPFGGTIACCYILLAFIAHYAFKQRQLWARNAIIAAFGFWVIIDSTVCILFRVYPQIYIINLFSIIIKTLPIIFTWKYFTKQ